MEKDTSKCRQGKNIEPQKNKNLSKSKKEKGWQLATWNIQCLNSTEIEPAHEFEKNNVI